MTVTIEALSEAKTHAERAALVNLLRDAVEGGASVGFVLPLSDEEAGAYWDGVAAAVGEGSRLLLVAHRDGHIAGTVQLAMETRRNGLHRAEVSKLLVLRSARRQGIARALMGALEEQARQHGRTTLFLDTRLGDPAERLYQALGYQFAGSIPRYARPRTAARWSRTPSTTTCWTGRARSRAPSASLPDLSPRTSQGARR